MIDINHFHCFICLQVARNAVELKCCYKILCKECAQSSIEKSSTCPHCRNDDFEWQDSYAIRQIVASIPINCEHCREKIVIGKVENHSRECKFLPRKCKFSECNFKGKLDELVAHVGKEHKKEFIRLFDKGTPTLSKYQQDTNFYDTTIEGLTNSKGNSCSIGERNKLYCGQELGFDCHCCDGSCGPDNGCNCRDCMELDLKVRKLPKGYWVNHEGANCTMENGVMYCGRKQYYDSAYCSKSNNCDSCKRLQKNIKNYEGLN